jgi:hypothetical protein
VNYAVSLTVVPGQAPGIFVPVTIIVLTAAESLGSEVVGYASSLSMDLHLSEARVQEAVAGLLDQVWGPSTGEVG